MQWSQQASSHRRSTSNSARQLHDELKSVEDGGESPIADDTAYGAPALQADKIERVSKTGQPHENEPADENERVGSGRESPAALSEKKSSLLGAAAFFGLLGGLVGTIAGGSLLIFFFSLAYSPLAPSWRRSVSVEDVSNAPSGNRKAMVSRDDIAWKIVLVPAGIGLTLGAIAGGIGSAAGKVTNG